MHKGYLLSWIISTILLLYSAPTESSQDCLRDGEKSQYECTIDFREGNLEWNGTGFDCSHRIILPLFKTVDDCHESNPRIRGRCNPYTGVISNCSRSDTNQTSVLTFDADYNLMNGGQIFCTLGDNVIQVFNIRVGVLPSPPEYANLTFPSNTLCQYEWNPPSRTVVGGIKGYNISYEGDCGNCSPVGLVSNTTFRATCSGWTANGQTCLFEIRTVTEDCGFFSVISNVTSIFDNTYPNDINVILICSQPENSNQMIVTWNYMLPELDKIEIPKVQAFIVTIYDRNNNSYFKRLNSSEARSHTFDSMSEEFQDAGLVGNERVINVTVVTDAGMFTNTSAAFSVSRLTVNTDPILEESMCIDVSINENCNENANLFQAQLKYAEGTCNPNTKFLTRNSTFHLAGIICIPVLNFTDPIFCFFVNILNTDTQTIVDGTQEQQLLLLQCNSSDLLFHSGNDIQANSRNGEIEPKADVPHNTVVHLSCEEDNFRLEGVNETRCVNGSFDPLITNTTQCTPSENNAVTNIPAIVVPVIVAATCLLVYLSVL